jgi:hypothetical protein
MTYRIVVGSFGGLPPFGVNRSFGRSRNEIISRIGNYFIEVQHLPVVRRGKDACRLYDMVQGLPIGRGYIFGGLPVYDARTEQAVTLKQVITGPPKLATLQPPSTAPPVSTGPASPLVSCRASSDGPYLVSTYPSFNHLHRG